MGKKFFKARFFTALVLILMMLVNIVACSKGDETTDPAQETEQTETASGEETQKTDGKKDKTDGKKDKDLGKPTPTPTKAPVATPSAESLKIIDYRESPDYKSVAQRRQEEGTVQVELTFNEDGTWSFSDGNRLYDCNIELTIKAPEGAVVYYNRNGVEPTAEDAVYSEPIKFRSNQGSFVKGSTFRACAVFASGERSKTAARTFFAMKDFDGRFTTVVISISGDAKELTKHPNGILSDDFMERGREYEREVYIEAWNPDGTPIFNQFGGVRVYGGYSRNNIIKSLKIFARKSYDPEHGTFKINTFGTVKEDGTNGIIKKYDKLVLRMHGNDFQFAFIRDELSQALCKAQGFSLIEGVIPAAVYMNGDYYGFVWMHESYCDRFFKEKFGDAEGEFVVLEGEDTVKSDDDDPLTQKYVDIYNAAYKRFSTSDLTNDATYEELKKFMDVENYLDYFAWNIALNNWDWPNNNFKCVRYVEASADKLAAEGALTTPDTEMFDGRWRFLYHDMDYTYGIYDQEKAMANVNTLSIVLNKNDERYSPLFAKLMEREDCVAYFKAKTYEYINGVLSEQGIRKVYQELHATRKTELSYFYKFIVNENRRGKSDFWVNEDNYESNESQIYKFARERAGYVARYMEEMFPEEQ